MEIIQASILSALLALGLSRTTCAQSPAEILVTALVRHWAP